MSDDLFSQAPTPITDKHVYKTTERDVGFDVIAPTVARGLERRVMQVLDLAGRMARALQRGPFESEENFGRRREVLHEEYVKTMEAMKS